MLKAISFNDSKSYFYYLIQLTVVNKTLSGFYVFENINLSKKLRKLSHGKASLFLVIFIWLNVFQIKCRFFYGFKLK